jgi:hypothetical protein
MGEKSADSLGLSPTAAAPSSYSYAVDTVAGGGLSAAGRGVIIGDEGERSGDEDL